MNPDKSFFDRPAAAARSRLAGVAVAGLLAAGSACAGLVGATYDASISGDVAIGYASTFTDPANPTACIDTFGTCAFQGGGLVVAFAFADVSPTQATLTFSFSGQGGLPAGFDILLGSFLTTDGSLVTDVSYRVGTGRVSAGTFGLAAWDGSTARFIGRPAGSYFSAVPTAPFVFDVTLAPPSGVPEPASLVLAGAALACLGLVRGRRRRPAGNDAPSGPAAPAALGAR